jgi:hypothetical protein
MDLHYGTPNCPQKNEPKITSKSPIIPSKTFPKGVSLQFVLDSQRKIYIIRHFASTNENKSQLNRKCISISFLAFCKYKKLE